FKYGTSNKPLKVPPSDPEYLKYQATVRYRVMREWIVPQKYTEEGGGNYNARLEVLINLDGEVTSIRWASHSGNESFDQSAMRAIKKASPFPKPPDRLAWEAYNEGFLIEFDPRIKVRY
ncbi:MAG: energy transducer TonB, partial [bacterium]